MATIFSAITMNIEKAVKIPTIVINVKTSTKCIATGIICTTDNITKKKLNFIHKD